MIDSDEKKYTVELLRNWKNDAENQLRENLEGLGGYSSGSFSRSLMVQANILEDLGEIFSGEAEKLIETLRNSWREGRLSEVNRQLVQLKSNNNRWNILSNEVKAKIIRFEAGLALDQTHDLHIVQELADQAFILDPANERQARLRALIARQRGKVDEAIQYLTTVDDVDSRNLLAACYLEIGNKAKCYEVLSSIKPDETTPETHRLLAIWYLFNKNTRQARQSIEKAEQLAPKWYLVQFTRIMIDYFSAVSPAALPDGPILWPDPITPDMIRRDAESGLYLENALILLGNLSQNENVTIDLEVIQNWYLAVKLVHSERQDNCKELIDTGLQTNPGNYYLISWALELNYEFDWAVSKKAILDLFESQSAKIFHLVALIGLLIKLKEFEFAEEMLVEKVGIFESQNAKPLWAFWMIQLLGLRGKTKEVENLLENFEMDPNLRFAKGLVLYVQSRRSHNNTEVIDYLEKQFAETNDGLFLLQACRLKYGVGDWSYITSKARTLVDLIQTEDILRFSLSAAFNAKNFALCLELIDQNRDFFGKDYPADIRRLKAVCLRELGLVNDAITEIEADASQSTETLFHKAQLYLQIGDLTKFSLIGRELSYKQDLKPLAALQLAHYLRQIDPELAKVFFKKAQSTEFPNKYLGNLLLTAFNLGLDDESKPIHEQINRVGYDEVGLHPVSLTELQEIIIQQSQGAKNQESLYFRASIPVHLFAQTQGISSLIHIYHTNLTYNEQSVPFDKVPIFVRHGGKLEIQPIKNPSLTSLYIDITSILLAEAFGILDQVEKLFNNLIITDDLIVCLIEMREQILAQQPSRIELAKKIVSLVEQRKLKLIPVGYSAVASESIETFLDLALRNRGHLLVFGNMIDCSDGKENNPGLINARSIIEALREGGKILPEQYSEAIRIVDHEGSQNLESNLNLGVHLYCWQNTLELLADAGLLEFVCTYFDVSIQSNYFQQKKMMVKQEHEQQAISHWLARLIERLRQGVVNRKYHFVKSSQIEKTQDKLNLTSHLDTMLTFSWEGDVVIWSDDRYVNGFSNRGGIPIVGISEIFRTLLENLCVDDGMFFSYLTKIRTANLLFVPLNVNETLFYLYQSYNDEQNDVIETPGLSAIRIYAMRVLELSKYIQKPGNSQANPKGEIIYFLQYSHVSQEIISKIWESQESILEKKQILSNWVLDNLFVDYHALASYLYIDQNKEHQEYLLALKFVSLWLAGINISRDRDSSKSLRRQYFEWVFDRIVGVHIHNPNIFRKSVDLLKANILENIQNRDPDAPIELLKQVYQDYYSELPETVQQIMEEDAKFMAEIGVQFVVKIDKYHFAQRVFWDLVQSTLSNAQVEAKPINVMESVLFKREGNSILIIDSKEKLIGNLEIPEMSILSVNRDDVLAFIRQKQATLDVSPNELPRVVSSIFSITDNLSRIDKLLEWEKASLTGDYAKLYKQLQENRKFALIDLLPPNSKKISRYYFLNLKTTNQFQHVWQKTVRDLLNAYSITIAANRVFGIPIPLTDKLIARFRSLEYKRQKKAVKILLRNSGSPVSKIHLAKLLLQLGSKNRAYRRLGELKLKHIQSREFENEVKAFLSVLRWTFSYLVNENGDSVEEKLLIAWTHTHHLFSIFMATGASVDWIYDFFSRTASIPNNLFDDEQSLATDICFSTNILSPRFFVVHGIAYCLADIPDYADQQSIENIVNLCFVKLSDRILPNPYIMSDTAILPDRLGSVWSGNLDHNMASVLGYDGAAFLSSTNLNSYLESALDNLASRQNDVAAWIELFALTRGICIPEAIKTKLSLIIADFDYCQMYEDNIKLGNLAYHLASIFSFTMKEMTLAEKINSHIIPITEKLANLFPYRSIEQLDDDLRKDVLEAVGIVLEVALNLSKLKNTPEQRIEAFVELAKEIATKWDFFAVTAKPIIQTLCEILPVEQSKFLWHLLIFLRKFEQ